MKEIIYGYSNNYNKTLTFWNLGLSSFSSSTITLVDTLTKLSSSESLSVAPTKSLIDTRKVNVSCVCKIRDRK